MQIHFSPNLQKHPYFGGSRFFRKTYSAIFWTANFIYYKAQFIKNYLVKNKEEVVNKASYF